MPDLTVGTEIEYPMVQPDEESTTFQRPSHYSGRVKDRVRGDYGQHGWPDGQAGSDPTAGLELRSDPMNTDELRDWYRMSIAELSKYEPHEPTGITANSSASTIGLHLHVSPLSSNTARALYDMSTEPWFRIFACSSIVDEPDGRTTFQLFRNNYCHMNFSDAPGSDNDCVTLVNDHESHWEWRMLEPVTPDHFDLVMDFIEKLKRDPADAEAFARDLVDNADPRLTAIKRAEKIGVIERLESEASTLTNEIDVGRHAFGETEHFWDQVVTDSEMPYIYRADWDGETYYVMYSENYGPSNDFSAAGIDFDHNSVLRADSLEFVFGDEADELREAIVRERQGIDHSDSPNKTEATDVLVDKLATSREIAGPNGGDVNV